MCSWRESLLAVGALLLSAAALAQSAALPGIGRPATPREIAAWDIDVRPDFKGLPPGSGSVARGQEVWEAQCASCHGVFGESGEVFNPVVGGTTRADVERGRVARLTDAGYPGRTTLMKASQVSTLWDYINRAMPWTAPKSLSVEEVYAVTAYVLNLGGVLPDDFVLSDRNIADVQRRLPNRDGMTQRHALWPGREFGGSARPDVQGSACMRDCGGEPKLASFLPDFARDAHGNLADQNREVGAQRGADTRRAAANQPVAAATSPPAPANAAALAQKHGCTACHAIDSRILGPSFREIAARHAGRDDASTWLAGRIKAGSSGAWGTIPMPPQSAPDADLRSIADWLARGAAP
ncbi:c-type cytochrome [uncultured Methylibium sp.]|uniref:c-type cytochrome n=1 Tax=uncultured Methylibium sp. TaxID=381093 RepID=UPI0025EBD1F7|nr:c-type cytochrome [uncultured Methylibium sp.]